MVRFYFLLYFYLFYIASNSINSHRYRPPLVAEVISISFALKNFLLGQR